MPVVVQEVYGYERSIVKTSVTWVFIVLTAGLLRLFFFWLPHLMVRAMNKRCSLDRATVLVFRVSSICRCRLRYFLNVTEYYKEIYNLHWFRKYAWSHLVILLGPL
ncbi:hypothetical protein DPMN_105940 [Dreissena polymorpha]|uniref:Cation-transporting ATPase n=1 Tax=Dreissena polymorpha TaxID=45954 RepID=A0A9D4QHX7_DREPO|nr:hypothetical protein DPMN_105940 [Dreissena polymorpha]